MPPRLIGKATAGYMAGLELDVDIRHEQLELNRILGSLHARKEVLQAEKRIQFLGLDEGGLTEYQLHGVEPGRSERRA